MQRIEVKVELRAGLVISWILMIVAFVHFLFLLIAMSVPSSLRVEEISPTLQFMGVTALAIAIILNIIESRCKE
ncbi:MAG: hypothetical protein OEY39_00870 [Candidatus Bathyarchaeota archaeon]|nr:hypothetical protein [Candidatus Bathyarchaeota archaeon]